MNGDALLYTGSFMIAFWGLAHIVMTKKIVDDFKLESIDKRRVLTMEWVTEGLTLCFIGGLVVVVTVWGGSKSPASIVVYRSSTVMLVIMAVLSLFTGARTPAVPYKICPPLFMTVAALYFLGSLF
ncbi:MAG: hypothetical protein JW984_14145 [Deltaproteobacteria bacterium]|uniref:Uncharacterized protein n=1 Tax=Candidatus Zymogenus saltonus TaxID=2844893 RepID=A0A9D8PNT8_9DELT|nr:hypothetical protein [Candidatus Zymogenus saltonus]